MESFSKFASRFEKNLNLNRNMQGRDSSDRLRAEREYERRRLEKNQINIDQIKEVVTDSNSDQLDAIQDLFYDERVDREASGKELLRAVDNNQKLLNKNFRLLSDMKDDLDSDDGLDLREKIPSIRHLPKKPLSILRIMSIKKMLSATVMSRQLWKKWMRNPMAGLRREWTPLRDC